MFYKNIRNALLLLGAFGISHIAFGMNEKKIDKQVAQALFKNLPRRSGCNLIAKFLPNLDLLSFSQTGADVRASIFEDPDNQLTLTIYKNAHIDFNRRQITNNENNDKNKEALFSLIKQFTDMHKVGKNKLYDVNQKIRINLELIGSNITDEEMSKFLDLNRLNSILFDNCENITGNFPKNNLAKLSIHNCPNFNENNLVTCPELEELSILDSASFTGAGLNSKTLKKLKKLSIHSCPNFNENNLVTCQQLEELSVHSSDNFTGTELNSKTLKKLKKLSIHSCPNFDENNLNACQQLEELSVHSSDNFTGTELNSKTLKKLSIRECPNFDENNLDACQQLEELSIYGSKSFTGAELNLNKLKHFKICYCDNFNNTAFNQRYSFESHRTRDPIYQYHFYTNPRLK